jgi:hypothetical protein
MFINIFSMKFVIILVEFLYYFENQTLSAILSIECIER